MGVRFDDTSNYKDDGTSSVGYIYPADPMRDQRSSAEELGYRSANVRDFLNDLDERGLRTHQSGAKEYITSEINRRNALDPNDPLYISDDDLKAINDSLVSNQNNTTNLELYAYALDFEAQAGKPAYFMMSPAEAMNNLMDPVVSSTDTSDKTLATQMSLYMGNVPQYDVEIASLDHLKSALVNKQFDADTVEILFPDSTSYARDDFQAYFDQNIVNFGMDETFKDQYFGNIDFANPTDEQIACAVLIGRANMSPSYFDENGDELPGFSNWTELSEAMEAGDVAKVSELVGPYYNTSSESITPDMVDAYVPIAEEQKAAEEQAKADAQAQAEADAQAAEDHADYVDSYDSRDLAKMCYVMDNLTVNGVTVDGEELSLSEVANVYGVDLSGVPQYTAGQYNSACKTEITDTLQSDLDAYILEAGSLTELLENGDYTTSEMNQIVATTLGVDLATIQNAEQNEWARGYATTQNPETGESYTYVEYLEAKYGDEYSALHDELSAAVDGLEAEDQSEDDDTPADDQPEDDDTPADDQPEDDDTPADDQPADDDGTYVDDGEMGDAGYDQRAADFAMFTYMTAHDGAFGTGVAHRAEEFEKYCVENGLPYTAEDFPEVQGMVDDLILNNHWDYTTIPGWSDYQASLGKEVEYDNPDVDSDEMGDQQDTDEAETEDSEYNDADFYEDSTETETEYNDTGIYRGVNVIIPGLDLTTAENEYCTYDTFADRDAAEDAAQLASVLTGLSSGQVTVLIQDPSKVSEYGFAESGFARDYFENISDQIEATGETFTSEDYANLSTSIVTKANEATECYNNTLAIEEQAAKVAEQQADFNA